MSVLRSKPVEVLKGCCLLRMHKRRGHTLQLTLGHPEAWILEKGEVVKILRSCLMEVLRRLLMEIVRGWLMKGRLLLVT